MTHKLYEYLDTVHSPYEAFVFDTAQGNFPVHKHWHYFLEMIYAFEGSFRAVCDGKEYLVSEGDLLLCHSQSMHEFYAATDPETGEEKHAVYGVIQCDLNQLKTIHSYVPRFRYVLRAAKQSPDMQILFRKDELRGIEVRELFSACIRERKQQDYGYDMLLNMYISGLLTHILRLWRSRGFDPGMVSIPQVSGMGLEQVVEYIDAHSNEHLKVQELAQLCDMSYSYFAKCFHEYYGMSCKDYIEYIKISKAEDLVLFTNYDLKQISQEIGYSDCSHFIKEYRKHKGITPKQHRMQVRAKKQTKNTSKKE